MHLPFNDMPHPAHLNQPGAYYKDLLNQLDQGYILVEVLFDKKDKPVDIFYIEANAAANRMTGTELAGKRTSELDPNYEQHWFDIFGRVAKTGIAERHELSATPLGVYYQVHAFKVGTPDEHKIAVIYEDVTERRLVQSAAGALHKSEEQFRLFITASSSMVYKMSADWKEMYTLAGKNVLADTEQATGNWVDKYIPEEDRDLVWRTIKAAIDSKNIFELEHRVLQANGLIGWVFSRAVPVFNTQGGITEWLGAGSDITQRKADEARQQFSLKLSDTLRPLANPIDIKAEAMRVLGEQFDAVRTQYWEVEADGQTCNSDGGYARGVPRITDSLRMDDFGLFIQQTLAAGKTLTVDNVAADLRVEEEFRAAYITYGIQSYAGVPLIKGGRLVAILTVYLAHAHEWTTNEVIITQETAERTWTATERAKAEEALRESEERLQLAIKGANIFTWDVEPETGETNYSANFNEVIGFEISKISEDNFIHVHPDDEKFVLQATRAALTSETPLDVEHRVINPQTKKEIWVRVQGQMVQKAGGKGTFIGITQNITERRLAEEVLKDYRTRLEQEVADRTGDLHQNYTLLQTVYNTTLIGMSVFSPVRDEQGTITDFKIIIVNKKVERTAGRNDLAGKLYAQIFPGIKQMGLFDLMVKTIETGEPGKMEYHYTYEGIDSWYSTMFVKGEDVLVSTNLDITEQKLAEEQRLRDFVLLKQSEELAGTGSWDYDLVNGNFIWSDGMYRLFNVQKEKEIRPEIYLQYATPECRETANRVVRHIEQGDAEFDEVLNIRIGDTVKVLKLKAAVIKNAEGHPVRVLGVDMDVTATREAEDRLKQMDAAQQLEIARVILRTQEEERRRISESLHNGLGQLLYATKMSLAQLTKQRAKDTPQEYDSARRYTSELLSDAMRDTRSISHELRPAILDEFGLEAAVKELCEQLQNGVKFQCSVDTGGHAVNKYIQLVIFRTLQELMMNVIKHAQATEAMAEVRIENRHIMAVVSDNGRGIHEDVYSKDGIGLASIRSKVDLLNGTINIHSKPGEGTTVRVLLPYID